MDQGTREDFIESPGRWQEIGLFHLYFNSNVITNPLFFDNALIEISRIPLSELTDNSGKWQEFGDFHLKIEKWNKWFHSIPIL